MRGNVKEAGMNLRNIKEIRESIPKLNNNAFRLRTVLRVLIILGVIAIAVIAALIRGQLIDVRNYSVPTSSPGKVRIAAISDLHGSMLGNDQERVVSRVQKADPDIIVYLGDMVERTRAEESAESLEVLTRRLIQIAPVYYVEGNHEGDLKEDDPEVYAKLNASLAGAGAVKLENDTSRFVLGSSVINLCGITTHYNWGEKEYALTADLRERDGINILLCHYPESVIWFRAFEGGGLDLALCGHTHGGLIRVPFKGGLYAPEWGWWPMYDLGKYPIYSDTLWRYYGGGGGAEYWGTMIISGGLAGEHGVPRVNNPMEISVVDIGQ